MGAWEAAIFDDDLAADVRDDYRELLERRVPDDEATQQLIASYADTQTDDDGHTFWLALAAAQHIVGRLDDEVKTRALQIIDTGRGMELWESVGGGDLTRRKKMLARLRGQLTGPQPPPKQVRRPRQTSTDLVAGDVLALTSENGATAVLRVLRVERSRSGQQPIVALLDWSGDLPTPDEVADLPIRSDRDLFRYEDDAWLVRTPRPAVYAPFHDRREPDWSGAGFVRVARITRLAEADTELSGGMSWSTLAMLLVDVLER